MVAIRRLLLAFGLLCLIALFVGEADGFRLREHGQEDGGLVLVKRKVVPRGKGDAPWSAVTRKPWAVKDDDDDDDDDEDDEEEDEADGDDEETEEQAAIRRATQERLLRARHGMKNRGKRTLSASGGRKEMVRDQGDDDDDDDDDDDEEDEAEPRSIFNLFGLLGSKQRKSEDERREATAGDGNAGTGDDDDDEDDDEDDEEDDDDNEENETEVRKHSGKVNRKPVKVEKQAKKGAKKESPLSQPTKQDLVKEAESWLEGLKRAFETVIKPNADDTQRDAPAGGYLQWFQSLTLDTSSPDPSDSKEKENPIINLLSSWLQSAEAGDSQEEIRFRPIGAYADDDDDDDSGSSRKRKPPTKQPPDSKLVQLLNHSPIASLFSAEELPTESTIANGPKRPKQPAPGMNGPARVVKQRIAISPEDFEQLLLRVPSFVPDYSQVRGEECRRQGEIFERQLRGKRLWALQMVDASARLASGLLRGNANQLGDFDLCTGIATRVRVREDELVRLRGKYCLAHVDVVAEDAELRVPVHLLQGGGFVKSTLNDPDHFLPRFTTINWGICLPAACSFEDAGSIVQHFVRPYNSTGIKLFLELEEANCHVRQVRTWSRLLKDHWQLVAVFGFYTFVAVVTLVATLNDYEIFIKIEPPSTQDSPLDPPERRTTNVFHQTLMAFSLKQTLPQLFGAGAGDDQQPCLHGLKAFASGALFLALRLVPLGYQPFTNRNEFTDTFNAPWSVAVRLLMLYADVFLVVSGFLSAYHMVREYRERARVSWFKRIAGRYLRLAFPLVPVLMFYAWVWEHLGNGPQWGDVVTKNANLCKHGYLSNLLFMHNWYPIEETCAPHTFQLAIEMQLSVLAPFLMVILVRSPFYGTAAYVLLSALSTAIRFAATTEDRLTPYVFHGVRLTQLYRTLNLSFAETLHRLTPYLAGFGLGYLLQETGRPRQERGVRYAGWIGAAIALLWCVCFPLDIVRKDFRYEPGDAAQFAALAPLSWSLGLCWIIYYCITERDSCLNRLLSSRPLVCLGRLSYSLTLVQFLVFFYFAGSTRGSEVFSFTGYINRTEVCIALVASLTLTLLFDLPIQNVKRLLDQYGVFEGLEVPEPPIVLQPEVTDAEPSAEERGEEPVPEQEQEPATAEPEADFVSPFDEQDEDDGIWLRRRTTAPVEEQTSGEDFWAQRDKESDVKEPPEKESSGEDVPTVVNAEEPQPEQEEEVEEEEAEEEEEEEEDEEEEEEEIDEEKEVKRRPTTNGASWSRL